MKNTHIFIASLLAIVIMPLSAAAQGSSGGSAGAGAGTSVQIQAGAAGGTQDQSGIQQQDQVRDPSTHTGTEPDQTQQQTQDRTQINTTTSVPVNNGIQERDQLQTQTQIQDRLQIQPESTTTPAYSGAQLRQTIQEREQELAQEASSTPPQDQNIIRNENKVRLAVHALLSAQNLLGDIGPQVAQVAQQIDNSVQTTANAEAQIQARGFWTNLFFGGDTVAASALSQATLQNRSQIQLLTQLLAQASSTPEVQTQLQTQLQIMGQEQTRLQQLADSENSRWGIFSWRF